jgi:hypothetical protein
MNEMFPEYDFDYSKARPNRFAGMTHEKMKRTVVLDPDIARVFRSSESVNKILRAIIAAMPESAVEGDVSGGKNRVKK